MANLSNRDILLGAASRLFREKGYDGAGLSEILESSALPKGSLYHYFPGGKRSLAEAATRASGDMVEDLIDHAFADAGDYDGGGARLCRAIVQRGAQQDHVLACPVVSILHAGVHDTSLREIGVKVLAGWRTRLAGHAQRLSHPDPDWAAEHLIMQIEGAWMMAVAEQGHAPLIRLAQWLEGASTSPRSQDSPETTGQS